MLDFSPDFIYIFDFSRNIIEKDDFARDFPFQMTEDPEKTGSSSAFCHPIRNALPKGNQTSAADGPVDSNTIFALQSSRQFAFHH